jgi:hypothetical protein
MAPQAGKAKAESRLGPPFNPAHRYYVYRAPDSGGGKRLLIVDKACRFGGHGETYEIYAYEISRGTIVDHVIKQAELMDFALLGSISGFGANSYCKYGGDIHEFIRMYGTNPGKRSLWRRLARALGLSRR